MEQKTELGILRQHAKFFIHLPEKGEHHSEPITFYLAPGQEDLILKRLVRPS